MDDVHPPLIVFGFLCLIAVIIRIRFFGDGAPLREAWEIHGQETAGKAVKAIGVITVLVWLAVWAAAPEEDGSKLNEDFKAYLDERKEGILELKRELDARKQESGVAQQ